MAAGRLPQRPVLSSARRWLIRALIAPVLAWNLSAAVPFMLAPATYAPAFELQGVPGAVMVRGMGILFLMWNVPHTAALLDPWRYRICVTVAVVQQLIGLLGEISMALTLPPGHAALLDTGLRFIAFDSAGLVLLAVAQSILLFSARHHEQHLLP